MKVNRVYICLILLTITLFTYRLVGNCEFINFDDNIYVTNNSFVKNGFTAESILWAFQTTDAGLWHPLTWFSIMLDYKLYGQSPFGYHWTNVILHSLNTILLFLFISRTTNALWKSAFIAALFAVHPLHVESVAWVSERKDVLSSLFWFLTLLAYVHFLKDRKASAYIKMLFLFICGLLSKPMLVTLPFTLLLLDYWPLKRIKINGCLTIPWRQIWLLVYEKIPLMLLSFCFSLIAYFAQSEAKAVTSISVDLAIKNTFLSYVGYIIKMIFPINLIAFYPLPSTILFWKAGLSILVIIGITGTVFKFASKHPYLLFGWFWYLGTLIPVIGIVQIGGQSMADRYTYIPLIGLFISLTWYISDYFTNHFLINKKILLFVGIACIGILSILATNQLSYWKNSITLFKHANIVKGSYLSHYNLGMALKDKGDIDNAIHEYRSAIAYSPTNAEVHNNLALALIAKGDYDKAIEELTIVIRINPSHAGAFNNMAMILYLQNKIKFAIPYFMEAIRLQPNYANSHFYLAMALKKDDKLKESDIHFKKAVNINPAYNNMIPFE
ncbi:MAG: tetratricopeptide repeat protein [Smithella sp.]